MSSRGHFSIRLAISTATAMAVITVPPFGDGLAEGFAPPPTSGVTVGEGEAGAVGLTSVGMGGTVTPSREKHTKMKHSKLSFISVFSILLLSSCSSVASFRRDLSKSAALQEVIQATTGRVVAAGIQWALDPTGKKKLADGWFHPYPESGK